MAPLTALPLLILGAGGLIVDTASPDALCPPLGPTREIVAARLGNVELEGTWRATYVLVHRREGDFVVLDLRDPDGVSRLRRQFPIQGGSCTTLSQVIALVLERFFLAPAGETRDTADPSVAPATTAATPATPPASGPPAAPAAISLAPDADSSTRSASPAAEDRGVSPENHDKAGIAPQPWNLRAGLWATNAWLSPSLRLSRHLAGPLALGINAGIDLRDHEGPVGAGSVRARRFPLSLVGSAELSRSRVVNSYVALELLGVFEHVWTAGLREIGYGNRVVPGMGLRIGADFFSSAALGPFAELTGAALFGTASNAFQVDHRAVATPQALVFGASFGIRTPF